MKKPHPNPPRRGGLKIQRTIEAIDIKIDKQNKNH